MYKFVFYYDQHVIFTRDNRNCYSASWPSQFCLSICHTGGSGKNGASYDHQIFTIGCPKDSSFRICNAFPKIP